MSAATFDWESERRRGLRKTVAISAVAHAVVVAVLVAGPAFHPRPVMLPTVVTVDLVAAPPAPSPRPAPAPRPMPRKVVLPASPTRVVAPVPTPKPRQPDKPVEEDYDDLLKRLRADAGEDRPEPVDLRPKTPPAPPTPAATPTPAPAVVPDTRAAVTSTSRGAVGQRASPEVAAWVRDARIHVRREWVLAAGFRLQDLETHVEVELDRDGHVIGEPTITRRSGNPWYDESVVRAIEKADPLPAPPEAGRWPFVFRPEDY